MYETEVKIRSTQVDSFGHMNHAAYLEVFEWARWEWAEALGMDLDELSRVRRLGPAVLHVDLTFLKELVMHEQIRVRTWMQELERVRGVMGQEMVKVDGQVAARMLLSFAMFHLDRRKVVAMPDELRAAFEADADHRQQRAAERPRPRKGLRKGLRKKP